MEKTKEFNSYKGLQKPLVFKMFKGRYIYIALATLIGAFILGITIAITLTMSVGVIVLLISGIGGLYVVLVKQKKNGLHKKNRSQGIYIVTHRKLSKFER